MRKDDYVRLFRGLLTLLATIPSVAGVLYEGPRFVSEPPGLVRFTNSSGVRLDCKGAGTPPVDVRWTMDSGEPVSYVPGVRESLSNGSLVFAAFPARLFRQDVHGARYRCVVSNSLGRIVSRTVRLKPVVLQSYRVTARDGSAPLGQTALLTCHVPDHVRASVQTTSWSVSGGLNVYPTLVGDDKYHMLPSGELLVSDVRRDDASSRFMCRTVHLMTDQHVISEQPAKVVILERKSEDGAPPRITASSSLSVRTGEDAVLFCIGQSDSDTPPHVSWSRGSPALGNPQAVLASGRDDVTIAGPVLVIRSARARHAGWYACRADSPSGHVTAELHLEVQLALSVKISPTHVTVNRGDVFRLTCTAPRPASLHWLKDGRRLDSSQQLTVTQEMTGDLVVSRLKGSDMKLSAQGMYQCFASSQQDTVQAAAQVLLGDSHPVLLEKFINHTVQPFSAVSLKCVANASPTPQISWLLDGYPLTPDHRRLIGQYVSADNDVISHVNMSAAQPVDGGWVTCRATNRFGSVSHTARLNIYGEPKVRDMSEVIAVAGEPLLLTCSVGGYPILEISWRKGDRTLPEGRQQHLLANGSLLLERVEKANGGGQYSCTALGPGRTSSTGHLTVSVIVPPAIRPFLLGNYSVGERVQVLCFIKSGDGPLSLTWLRDGRPLTDPEIIQRSTDRFSSSLSIERVHVRHAGNYTCRAANAARATSFTAELRVNVPPRWLLEPQDLSVRLGSSVLMHCTADGSPPVHITWTKTDEAGTPVPADSLHGVVVFPNGSLSIPVAVAEHQGLYACRATNGVGPPLTARPQLTVYAAPSFSDPSRVVRIREGQNVTLTCDPAGDEPMTFLWFRNDQPVQDNVRALVRHWVDSQNASRSRLRLMQAVPPDSGMFRCQATNAHGTAQLSVDLEIEETPLPPSSVQMVEILSRTITVEWHQPAKISRHITGYRLQYKQLDDEWDSAASVVLSGLRVQLTDLRPDTPYMLRPLAVTSLGAGPPGRTVHVRTEQAPPSLPPSDLSLVPLTSTEVKVTWRPPPADAHHGRLTGYRVTYSRVNSSDGVQSRSLNTSALSTSLNSLRPFSLYRVTVLACNARGCGPTSRPALVRTLEDVPSAAPDRVRCVSLGSRQLGLTWVSPPARHTNGNLRGYRVKTEATQERDGQLFFNVSDVRDPGMTVQQLTPHTNYSLRVAAVTGVGAGLFSRPVFCTTQQDVPSEPSAVAVAVTSQQSALVSWLPPEHPNGVLTSYSVHIRTVSPTAEASEQRVSVPASSLLYPLSGLSGQGDYAVRVAGHTAAGEGRPSRPVRFTTALSGNVPVQMVSLSHSVTVDEGDSLTLACRYVGSPRPSLTWYRDGQPVDKLRFNTQPDGTLQLDRVDRGDDGNYTCRAYNKDSSASVAYTVTVLGVPPAPTLLVSSATADSLLVRWSSGDPHGLVIRGYRLQYWPEALSGHDRGQGHRSEVTLERFVREYTLAGLTCGTVYHLQLRAFNRLGASEPSATLKARTAGRPPALADRDRLVTANGTEVTVRLDLWTAADCAVQQFVVRWRPADSREDVSANLSGGTRQHVIRRLLPAAAYVINVTAVSPAGAVSHVTAVTTHGSVDVGASSGPADLGPGAAPLGLRVVVPVLASLLSLLMIASAAYLCVRKRRRKVPLYLPESPGYSGARKGPEPPTLPPPPPLTPTSADLLKREELCPYATLFPVPAVTGAVRGTPELVAAGHCASLPTALASGGDLCNGPEALYADPRHRLQQTLPLAGSHQRQRVRSLPVSDEYDSPDSDSDSMGRPGQGRSASLRRSHRSHARDPRAFAESSSSSGQQSPDLRSRSLSSRRARRKRRRAKTPVLLPPPSELTCRPRTAAEIEGLLLQQLQLQHELASRRAVDSGDLDLRALAHTLKGRDFSINV